MSAISREPRASLASGTWQWARTAETQRGLLDAAAEVFAEQGFSNASIADIVQRAGSSVGSLYHHFGGKSELFTALWQQYQLAQEETATEAVAAARKAGATDSFELFSAGARALLDRSWQHRDLSLLFLSGDNPPGFEVLRRKLSHEWIVQNNALLRLPDTPLSRLYAAILTSLIAEGVREVALARNRRQANRIIDATIEYVHRLMADGPWNPPASQSR
jgi:AcrR family transcriptional regulator